MGKRGVQFSEEISKQYPLDFEFLIEKKESKSVKQIVALRPLISP